MEGLEISELRVEPCVDSRYIKPSRVVFKQVSHYILAYFPRHLKICVVHGTPTVRCKWNRASGVDLYPVWYSLCFLLAHSDPSSQFLRQVSMNAAQVSSVAVPQTFAGFKRIDEFCEYHFVEPAPRTAVSQYPLGIVLKFRTILKKDKNYIPRALAYCPYHKIAMFSIVWKFMVGRRKDSREIFCLYFTFIEKCKWFRNAVNKSSWKLRPKNTC